MQTRPFPFTSDARSPAGAEIRYLMEDETANIDTRPTLHKGRPVSFS
jgi:hypothetical protein